MKYYKLVCSKCDKPLGTFFYSTDFIYQISGGLFVSPENYETTLKGISLPTAEKPVSLLCENCLRDEESNKNE